MYITANSEEHAKLDKALQCSRHILEYVNQAVKEYENHYKLEHLQRKIEKKLDGLTQDDTRQIKVIRTFTLQNREKIRWSHSR